MIKNFFFYEKLISLMAEAVTSKYKVNLHINIANIAKPVWLSTGLNARGAPLDCSLLTLHI